MASKHLERQGMSQATAIVTAYRLQEIERTLITMQVVTTMVFQRLGKQTDALLAIGVLIILLIMMIPLPTIVMDMLLATNITIGVLILLNSIYVLKPLDFSIFPPLLLLTTLFRLALNVATTRLILLHGQDGPAAAGRVIEGFGQFVVGGNTVVGLIIFLILVLINFIVITKGSTRIAEVAARFTLDALPGKQMAIDADLNAGLIDDIQARKRREAIAREAEFYGAMDAEGISFTGVEKALAVPNTELRLFGKPKAFKRRRMGVALASASNIDEARGRARLAASEIKIQK